MKNILESIAILGKYIILKGYGIEALIICIWGFIVLLIVEKRKEPMSIRKILNMFAGYILLCFMTIAVYHMLKVVIHNA